MRGAALVAALAGLTGCPGPKGPRASVVSPVTLEIGHDGAALRGVTADGTQTFAAFVTPEVWETSAQRDGIVPGFPIGRWLPEHADGLLVCVTEVQSDEAIERLVACVGSAPGKARASAGGAR